MEIAISSGSFFRRLSQHGQRVGVTKVHPFGTVIRGLGCLGCVTPWQVPMGRAMSTSALHAQVGCAMGRFWVKNNHVRQRNHWLTQSHSAVSRIVKVENGWTFVNIDHFRPFGLLPIDSESTKKWIKTTWSWAGGGSLSRCRWGTHPCPCLRLEVTEESAQNLSFRLLVLWTELVGLYENGDWFCLSIFAHLRRDYIQLNNMYYIVILI